MNKDPEIDNPLHAATAAMLLGTISGRLNCWSMVGALASVLIVGLRTDGIYSRALFSASFAAALVQLYFALRCAFDAAVFKKLGGNVEQYHAFDRLLAQWKLRTESGSSSTIEQRTQGALRLLRRQGYSFMAQIALLAAGLLLIISEGR